MALPLSSLPFSDFSPMARVSRLTLYREARLACRALSLPPEALWVQHSGTGWHVYREAGPHGAASPLGECLTAREALCLLQGLTLAPELSRRAQ